MEFGPEPYLEVFKYASVSRVASLLPPEKLVYYLHNEALGPFIFIFKISLSVKSTAGQWMKSQYLKS
jgi:hypothetical protein